MQTFIAVLILALPLLAGLAVWKLKWQAAIALTDRWLNWVEKRKARADASSSKISKYWGRPSLKLLVCVANWTGGIRDPFARCGARVAAYGYTTAGIIIVGLIMAYFVIAIVVALLMIALALWLLGKYLDSSGGGGGGERDHPRWRDRVLGSRLVKEGFFGDQPTGVRVDEQGRILKEGFLGDAPTGRRIDEQGRIVKEGILGDTPTGKKIDDEGRLVEEGLLGDTAAGAKIDEEGRVVKEGLIGDVPTGTRYKKE